MNTRGSQVKASPNSLQTVVPGAIASRGATSSVVDTQIAFAQELLAVVFAMKFASVSGVSRSSSHSVGRKQLASSPKISM